VIEYVHMATGVGLVGYVGNEAPVGYPSATRNGNGDITITFPASLTDEYGLEYALTIAP
jgi:hypothetical protein